MLKVRIGASQLGKEGLLEFYRKIKAGFVDSKEEGYLTITFAELFWHIKDARSTAVILADLGYITLLSDQYRITMTSE